VEVDDGSGYAWVTTGVFWRKGSTVLDASYHQLSGVRVRSPSGNGWVGAIEYSSDGGATYAPFVCTDCTKGSSTARITVDGDSNALDSPTTCFGAAQSTCTLRTRTHLRITTTVDEGSLDVEVDDGSGYAWVTTGVFWRKGSTVLDASYHQLSGVRVRSPSGNGWVGAIEYSSDGGATYAPFVCTDCTKGSSTARITVDGDSNALDSPTTCFGAAQSTCTLALN